MSPRDRKKLDVMEHFRIDTADGEWRITHADAGVSVHGGDFLAAITVLDAIAEKVVSP